MSRTPHGQDTGPVNAPTSGAPKYARETDHGRYYQDPLDDALVPSCTNVLDEWSKPALPPAAAKITADYIIEHLPAAVRASLRPEVLKEFLRVAKSQYKRLWDERRDLGALIHRHVEAHVLGAPIAPDERVDPFLASYRAWLADFGVDLAADVQSAEITVLGRREPRYGATADLWVYLDFPDEWSAPDPRFKGRNPAPVHTPSGLWLVDIKTSVTKPASARYREQALQLAALRFADAALLPDDTEIPVPEFVGAAILNLRRTTSGYGFIPLPADADAFAAFQALVNVARYAHGLSLTPYKPAAAPAHAQAERKAA